MENAIYFFRDLLDFLYFNLDLYFDIYQLICPNHVRNRVSTTVFVSESVRKLLLGNWIRFISIKSIDLLHRLLNNKTLIDKKHIGSHIFLCFTDSFPGKKILIEIDKSIREVISEVILKELFEKTRLEFGE